MINHLTTICAMAILYSLLIPSTGFARKVEHWPYKRLFEEADLVVIANVQAGFAADEEWNEK